MKPYRLHAFICQGKRCAAKGSEGLYEEMKDRIKDLGLKGEIKLTKSGCQSVCKETETEGEFSPVMVMPAYIPPGMSKVPCSTALPQSGRR